MTRSQVRVLACAQKIMKSDVIAYFCIVLVALGAAVYFPAVFTPLSGFSTYILGTIFLITALQLTFKDIFLHVKEVRMVVLASVWLLVGLPILVYVVAIQVVPEEAIALLLLSAMPAGMTAPLLTKIAGGSQEFSLVVAVITSLLAPLSVPLVTLWTIGTSVPVNAWSIALSLVYIILIPFIIGGFMTYVWPSVRDFSKKLHLVSLFLLGLLIAGLVSEQAGVIRQQIMDGSIVRPLAVLFLFFVILHFLGYLLALFGKRSLQVASIVSLVYMNFTLAIYLAYTFFPESGVVVPATLAIIPWALLLGPFVFIYRNIEPKD